VSASSHHAPPIAAHRLLGDGTATALLRPGGEVDWWCAPAMDSPPLLWSLLDAAGSASRWRGLRAASASGAAAGPVLTTTLHGATGRVQCRDALHCSQDRGSSLIRLVRGLDADLALEHEVAVGGFDSPQGLWETGVGGWTAAVAGQQLRVLGGVSVVDGSWLRTRVRAPQGDWAAVVVTLDARRVLDIAALRADLDAAEQEDVVLLDRARLPTSSPERARDALRVVRQCTYAPTGAVVASPTTSLPESPGHDRQFDYRYSWLRDASLAVSVAALLGRVEVSERYLDFILGQTKGGGLPDGPMTDVRGHKVPDEHEVDGVSGWAGSLPIRVGNGANGQLQYDALGLFVEAVSVQLQQGARLRPQVWQAVQQVADGVSEPDLERRTSGIWELREPAELVSGDIGIWIALDRALWIARVFRPWTRHPRWVRARREARDRVLGALLPGGGLPQAYGGGPRSADASALLAVMFRLLDRRDPRASALVDATLRELDCAPFLYRYEPGGDDGFAGREGAFLPASWWVVSALAACGRVQEATARARELDRVLPALLPEELDPESRQGLGNVPLVWSHMEAARAMYVLDAARVRDRWSAAGLAVWRVSRWLQARNGRDSSS